MGNDQRFEVRLPANLLEQIDKVRETSKPFISLSRSDLVRNFIQQGLNNASKAESTTGTSNWLSLMSSLQLFLQISALEMTPHTGYNTYWNCPNNPNANLVFLVKQVFDHGYLWFLHLKPSDVANIFCYENSQQLGLVFDKFDEVISSKFDFVKRLLDAFDIVKDLLQIVGTDVAQRIKHIAAQNNIILEFEGCNDLQLAQMASMLKNIHYSTASKGYISISKVLYDASFPGISAYERFLNVFKSELRNTPCAPHHIRDNSETSHVFLNRLAMPL